MGNLFNIKSFITFLSKHKLYTFIDIFGLSVSLMFVLIISVYTYHELSTDSYHTDKDRIYILANEEDYGVAYKIGDRLLERYPGIEQICAITHSTFFGDLLVEGSMLGNSLKASVVWTDTTFFNFFDFKLLYGDPKTALGAKNYIVISESFARKTFPGIDPVGQPLRLNGENTFIVNGVIKDISNSTVPYGDLLMRIDNISMVDGGITESPELWNASGTFMFVKTFPGVDINEQTEDLASHLKKNYWIYESGNYTNAYFVPLKDIYFSSLSGHSVLEKGDKQFVIILLTIAFVILIFAIINYINLTIAQAGFRAKEMATRRLMGSSRKELFIRMISEATILSFISFLLAVFLAVLVFPYAENLLNTHIDLKELLTPVGVVLSLIVVFGIGLIAGFLPAIVISNAKAIEVVKGGFRQKSKMVFSRFFITFQNIITISLVAAAITIYLQIDHLIHAPLGYNTTDLIHVETGHLDNTRIHTLANEFKQIPGVKRIGYSQQVPIHGTVSYVQYYDGKQVSIQQFVADSTFVNMMGLKVVRENDLADPDAYYLTRQAIKEMGITEDDYSVTNDEGGVTSIAGVMEDFYFQNRTHTLTPSTFQIKRPEEFPWNSIWYLTVEVEGDRYAVYHNLKDRFENVAQLDFTAKFIDQQVQDSFDGQIRLSRIVTLFAFIAVLISLLGLLAMSTYFIQQRSREVVVRKVFGSTNNEILKRLILTFQSYVFIAFIIAVPIIWYIMKRWLSEYDYRISLSPMIFVTAGLFCLVISFLTVFWQSFKVANDNPVNNLKTE